MNLAQRFSAGKSAPNNSSPGGTTEFSRTHFGPGGTALPPARRAVSADFEPRHQDVKVAIPL
jgi:hypothetical protein